MDPIKVEFNINFYRESSCFYEEKKTKKKKLCLHSSINFYFFIFFFLCSLVSLLLSALWFLCSLEDEFDKKGYREIESDGIF